MIKCTFRLIDEIVEVIIQGNNLFFVDTKGTITTIEGLKFDKAGVIREFSDLKDDEEWKRKSIERFKEYYRKLETEKEKMEYIKQELTKSGYEPLFFQIAGFRRQKFKEN